MESGLGDGQSGHNQNFTGAHDRCRRRVFGYGCQRGDITAADIFGERRLHGAADFVWVKRLHERKVSEMKMIEK